MTKSEYIPLLEKAKIDSVEKRWVPLRDEYADYINCPLCDISTRYFNDSCRPCPIYGNLPVVQCCKEYHIWYNNRNKGNAQAVIDRINAIDVEAWADKLVEMGVLEND